jgi:hypothetical protein
MLSVVTKGVLILSTVIRGCVTPSVANKPFMLSVIMLNVNMLSVIMLNVIMLSVVCS